MRAWSLITVLLVASCTVRLPSPGQLGINFKATTRVEVQVAPPAPVVALENAPVVEFFGIPLGDAQDVVFVLDCSGSMADGAVGRIATLHSAPPPGPPPSEGPPPGPPPSEASPPGPMQPGAPPPSATPMGYPPDSVQQSGPVAGSSSTVATTSVGRKIDVAQAELVEAVERLPAGTRMNVIFFNNGLEAFSIDMVPLADQNRASLVDFVKQTTPRGGTALAPAMRTALLMNARRVVLLSDGLGNIGGNAEAVLRDAREAMRGGVRIDTIGLGHDQDGDLLGSLARESGGLYQAF